MGGNFLGKWGKGGGWFWDFFFFLVIFFFYFFFFVLFFCFFFLPFFWVSVQDTHSQNNRPRPPIKGFLPTLTRKAGQKLKNLGFAKGGSKEHENGDEPRALYD